MTRATVALVLFASVAAADRVLGPEHPTGKYKHSPSITELPNGDLYMAFYSGESEYSPDTAIYGSRYRDGKWSAPKKIAASAEPLGNPVVWARDAELVLNYVVRKGATWSTAITVGSRSRDGGATWSAQKVLSDKPGMMIRNRPLKLASGRWLIPAYIETGSDGEFLPPDTSSVALFEDGTVSAPIRSRIGNLQPAIVELARDHLLAYCRRGGGYSGKERAFVVRSESRDGGKTWAAGVETEFPNPNAAVDLLKLRDGRLLLVYNDSFAKRTPMRVQLVEPKRGEPVTVADGPHGYAYPYAIQSRDGKIHLLFSEDRLYIHHVVLDPTQFVR